MTKRYERTTINGQASTTLRHKPNRKRIDAVAGIFCRKTLAFKHVTEVAAAVGAHDFYPFHAERIVHVPDDGAGNFVVKRRPAAAAVELVRRTVKWRVAAPANESPGGFMVPIFAGEGAFGAFLGDDVLFLFGEGVPVLAVIFHKFGLKIWS